MIHVGLRETRKQKHKASPSIAQVGLPLLVPLLVDLAERHPKAHPVRYHAHRAREPTYGPTQRQADSKRARVTDRPSALRPPPRARKSARGPAARRGALTPAGRVWREPGARYAPERIARRAPPQSAPDS